MQSSLQYTVSPEHHGTRVVLITHILMKYEPWTLWKLLLIWGKASAKWINVITEEYFQNILYGTSDTFSELFDNKKFKRTVFIHNNNFVLHYRLPFRNVGTVHLIFLSFFLKEINTFIQQGCVKLIISRSKDLYG